MATHPLPAEALPATDIGSPALRIAVAGKRRLLESAQAPLAARCTTLFDGIQARMLQQARRLAEVDGNAAPPRPQLVLLSGLADGADQCIASTFLAGQTPAANRQHVAVLPFAEAPYRDLSPIADKPTFGRLLAASAVVIELDGRWPTAATPAEPQPGEGFARYCRARAYRSQARVMLQRADLLLAVFNPDEAGRPGGTLETMRAAINLRLPVLALAVGDDDDPAPSLYLLRSMPELEALTVWRHALPTVAVDEQAGMLGTLVDELAAPSRALEPAPPDLGWRQRLWARFERYFDTLPRHPGSPAETAAMTTEPDSPFHRLRLQVEALTGGYTGRYRSAFLTNFRFAAAATTLAASSLGVMVLAYKFAGEEWPGWIKPVLLALALCKLVLVVTISRVSESAIHGRWNEQAVSARFLAENLRLLVWLPALGKLRLPQRLGEHHTGAKLGSGAADDWLGSAVRAAPPETGLVRKADAGAPLRGILEPRAGLERLLHGWLLGQIQYHHRNASKLSMMARVLDRRVEFMNTFVVAFVALDIALLAIGVFAHHLFWTWDVIKVALVVGAASLPAAVAATNGIREQSEAERLAERSEQLAGSLQGLRADAQALLDRMNRLKGSPQDPGAWTLEALDIAERCATLVAEDVAEWTVLYGKEVPEP